ncbi:conserved hypothetical protein [Leishmania major strain Friedlin]|uniref:Ubiquitin-like domain-containing protein n=1 Tax=Leishmania major TaxID=5664 RepID=Q4QJE0_LEIMA|nr:conserved hypothetical protein [Leishmania major strain Friedlin]CAG9568242.1 hypothetical_protein_-_conserved [Leishmania major strain Friedlin]CAJ01982.1 conserved hypothetical protein [Leishmania major strain Friedlin]|eukprot:XP_001687539.1 conserved hypothetical protein [Leishmania major strain Friedlin]
MSAMSSRDISTESLSLTASSRSAAKADGAAVPALTFVVIPARVAKQNIEEVLRRGSPSTRGLHSISPLAPNAARTPPADSRGPPRYLRARGITPSPAASSARGRREVREPPQSRQNSRRRRPFSRRRGDRHSSSRGSSHRHQGEGKQGKAQTASPPQPQSSEAASSDSQTPKSREMTAPPQLAVPAQLSNLLLPLPQNHRQLAPSDNQCGNQAQQEVQRRDRLSQPDDSGSAVAETQEQEQECSARAPSPRSKSPASAHASSLHKCNGTTAAAARAPARRSHVVDMVLTIPRLSPAQASPFAPSKQPQRTRRTGEDFRHGSSVQPAAWQQQLSKRPLQVGIPGRVGVPGKGSAAAVVTPSAAQRGTALSTSPQLVSTSPIARSYVVQSFSSHLPGESTVLLGAHHRGGPSPSSTPPPSSQAVGPSAGVAAATSMPAVVIEVAVVAAAAPSLPEPEVLQRYEDMLRQWHAGNSNGCSGGAPRHDGREAQQWYTHNDLSAAFDLIVHIQLAAAAAVTVSDIKDEVELRTGLPAAQQCLVYDAVLLQDCLPVCLLPSAADDDGVDDERGAAMGRSAGPDYWRLVCVPLSSASSPAAMARQTRRIESPPRAVASPAAATDATRYDDGGDEAAAALRSLLSVSPVRPRTQTSRAAEATATSPPRRPGAVPFTLSNGTTVTASTAATAGHTEQVVSEHINRLRLLYLSNAEMSDQFGRADLGFPVAAVERAPEHADPSTAAMAGVRPPTRPQRDLLLSPLREAPAVGAEHYRTRFGLSSSAAPISSACTPPPPRRTELSDALIAALPPPPVRRPVTLPYESIKTLSWKPSVHQTQPAQITASSSVGAGTNGGNGGGGVDASWMSSLNASFSSDAAAAVMM